MAKTKEGLDLGSDRMIKVCPVVGWIGFVPFGMAVGLRLEYAPSPDRFEKPEAVQLILNPPQARELAELLLRKADQAIQVPESNGRKN